MKSKYPTRPGVSLVIAMLMVLAFMIMMADMMQSMARSQQIGKGGHDADQAYLRAEDGVSLGLYAQNRPDTFPQLIKDLLSNDPSIDKDKSDPDNGKIVFKDGGMETWKVSSTQGNAQVCMENLKDIPLAANDIQGCSDDKKYYVYPFPGTGSVGGKDCDIKSQPIRYTKDWLLQIYQFMYGQAYAGNDITQAKTPDGKSDFVSSISGLDVLDHPCFWNKLSNGNAAEVPLFMTDKNGTVIGPITTDKNGNILDAAGNIDKFYVRARLPCKNGGACTGEGRWQLQFDNNQKNTRALVWDINATCKNNPICYLSEVTTNINGLNSSIITYDITKNGILATLKNVLLTFINIQNKLAGQDSSSTQEVGPIQDFLTSQGKWLNAGITKPFFHLSIAGPLYVDLNTKQTVDNIEYQILYTLKNAKLPPLITNPIVTAVGTSGGYRIALQSSVSKQTGVFSYALVGN